MALRDGHRRLYRLARRTRSQLKIMGNKEAVRRYRERNAERLRQLTRDWRNANKEVIAKTTRKYHLKKKGFSLDTYALALSLQNHACAICKTPFKELESRAIHADHDHASKAPRGVLCHMCNVGLGIFRDNPEFLMAASNYLFSPTMEKVVMLEPKVEELKAAVAENTAAILALAAALQGLSTLPTASTPVVQPQKTEAPAPTPAPAAADTPKTEPTTFDALKKDFLSLSTKVKDAAGNAFGGRAACEELLAKFGAAKLSNLVETQWAEAHAFVKDKLAV